MKGNNNDYPVGITHDDLYFGYNNAGSSSVREVDTVNITSDEHDIPKNGTPNSVSKNYLNGELHSERYYDNNGKAYLDIDYTDHGNPKHHPHVPHEHNIWFDDDGGFHRGPEGEIKK